MNISKQLCIILLSTFLFACGSSGSGDSSAGTNDGTVIKNDDLVPPTDDDEIIAESATVTINWDDNSDNEAGYIIERRLQSSDTFDSAVPLAENSNSYDDKTVSVGNSYCYKVSAFNQAGSAPSDEMCVDI